MSKNRYELDPERLATTDEFGHRVYLYPEEVHGIWKNRRDWVYWALIALYLILPWIYINEKPGLMVDIQHREFTLLGFTLHGMEPILFFLMLASGLFFLAFMTSLFGRVWCGWGCPQTVFIQSIFLPIERLIEGKARAREQLEAGPWNFNKIFKRILKWGLYLIVALHIAHTFVGYFVGPRELFALTMQGPTGHPLLFVLTMIATAIVLLDFGWFREQFCVIACPYGRIQSFMMDDNSLVVAYDRKRGEPRRGEVDRSAEGDCVNCYSCVKVCPTGIDIRRGTQLECIACTQCIDACDDIMTKLKKPTGLIAYRSEHELAGHPRKKFTGRSIIYLSICLSLVVAFAIFLNASTSLTPVFLRGRGAPFHVLKNETGQSVVVNNFIVHLKHQGDQDYSIEVRSTDADVVITQPLKPWRIRKSDEKNVLFFKAGHGAFVFGTKKIVVEFFDQQTGVVVATKEVTLVGPTE